jgi:hypothetical protein
VTTQLEAILRPLTSLYSNVFDTPLIGKMGHFEFLFEIISTLNYTEKDMLTISSSISKIIVAMGRSPYFNLDLITSFHESGLTKKLLESIRKSLKEDEMANSVLSFTLILQLLKVSILMTR